jgi:hypothetical protein
MRAKELALGAVAFVVGMLAGERVWVRLIADLSNAGLAAANVSFVAMAPKTFLFLGVVPFVAALALALKRLGVSPAVPSALSGFVWLPLYVLITGMASRFLHLGHPPRAWSGLLFMFVLVVVPPLVNYYVVFRGWMWLRPRSG